jgi:hypothetical protein
MSKDTDARLGISRIHVTLVHRGWLSTGTIIGLCYQPCYAVCIAPRFTILKMSSGFDTSNL